MASKGTTENLPDILRDSAHRALQRSDPTEDLRQHAGRLAGGGPRIEEMTPAFRIR